MEGESSSRSRSSSSHTRTFVPDRSRPNPHRRPTSNRQTTLRSITFFKNWENSSPMGQLSFNMDSILDSRETGSSGDQQSASLSERVRASPVPLAISTISPIPRRKTAAVTEEQAEEDESSRGSEEAEHAEQDNMSESQHSHLESIEFDDVEVSINDEQLSQSDPIPDAPEILQASQKSVSRKSLNSEKTRADTNSEKKHSKKQSTKKRQKQLETSETPTTQKSTKPTKSTSVKNDRHKPEEHGNRRHSLRGQVALPNLFLLGRNNVAKASMSGSMCPPVSRSVLKAKPTIPCPIPSLHQVPQPVADAVDAAAVTEEQAEEDESSRGSEEAEHAEQDNMSESQHSPVEPVELNKEQLSQSNTKSGTPEIPLEFRKSVPRRSLYSEKTRQDSIISAKKRLKKQSSKKRQKQLETSGIDELPISDTPSSVASYQQQAEESATRRHSLRGQVTMPNLFLLGRNNVADTSMIRAMSPPVSRSVLKAKQSASSSHQLQDDNDDDAEDNQSRQSSKSSQSHDKNSPVKPMRKKATKRKSTVTVTGSSKSAVPVTESRKSAVPVTESRKSAVPVTESGEGGQRSASVPSLDSSSEEEESQNKRQKSSRNKSSALKASPKKKSSRLFSVFGSKPQKEAAAVNSPEPLNTLSPVSFHIAGSRSGHHTRGRRRIAASKAADVEIPDSVPQASTSVPDLSAQSTSQASVDMSCDIRLWQGDHGWRSSLDLIDLDVILNKFEEIAWESRQSMELPAAKQACNVFAKSVQSDLRKTIIQATNMKRVYSNLKKSQTVLMRRRKQLFNSHKDLANLRYQLAKLQQKKSLVKS